MAAMTYYVALAFKRSDDNGDIVACDPKEARSADQAIGIAGSLTKEEGHCGAIGKVCMALLGPTIPCIAEA
jgi:hypothetical protein